MAGNDQIAGNDCITGNYHKTGNDQMTGSDVKSQHIFVVRWEVHVECKSICLVCFQHEHKNN